MVCCEKGDKQKMKKLWITLMSAFAILITLEWNDMSQVRAEGLREEAVRIAAAEVGYHEKETMDDLYDHTANSGDKNYTKYAVDLCVAYGQPWGATFFWWVMAQAGVPREAFPNYVSATTDWFRERNAYYDRGTYTPQPGDYAVLGNVANCGIVESVTETEVTVIAGNRGDSNAVTRFTVSLDDEYIKGYGVIDYDYVYQPTSLDFNDNYCAMLFKTSVGKYYRNYQGEPVLWSEFNRADYKWLFKKQTDGTYMIQSLYDGKVLEVKDAGTTRASVVTLGEIQTENNDHQKWYIMSFGVGHRLIPKNATNFCLDIYGENDGTTMQIWQHHEGMSQMTTFSPVDYVQLDEINIKLSYKEKIDVGETQILGYRLSPEDASANMVSWVSSDDSVATVDESGIVTAKKEGTVTITCKSTYDSSVFDEITIEVKKSSTEDDADNTEDSKDTENDSTTEEKGDITQKQEETTEQQDSTTEEKEESYDSTESEEIKVVKKGTVISSKKCRFVVTNVKKKTVKVTGVSDKKATTIKIPATVNYEGKTYKVTSIGKNAFKNNKKIKSVTIGNNVTTIEDNAFRGCKKLGTVVIGKEVKSIGKYAFYNCSKLKTIKIKTTKLKKVGKKTFKKIHKKAVIYTPKKVKKKYEKLFQGKI